MSVCDEIRPELPGFVSGDLDAPRRKVVADHLMICKECTRELAEIRQAIGFVELSAIEHKPREDLEELVFGFVDHEPEADLVASAPLEHTPPVDLERRSLERAGVLRRTDNWWDRYSPRIAPVLAVASLMLAALGVNWRGDAQAFEAQVGRLEGHYGPWGETQAKINMVPDTSMADAEVTAALVRYEQDNHRVVLYSEGLEPTEPGYHYAAWLVNDDGRFSCGTFRVEMVQLNPSVAWTVGVDPLDYPTLQISLEPNEGRPGLDGEIVMEANLTAASN